MPDVKVEVKNTMVAIGPGLIKKGQTIKVNLLTDGPVSLTCAHPQLADVIVKERRPDSRLSSVSAGLSYMPMSAVHGAAVGSALADALLAATSRIRSMWK